MADVNRRDEKQCDICNAFDKSWPFSRLDARTMLAGIEWIPARSMHE